jgi:flavin-dependent dehydrogenase
MAVAFFTDSDLLPRGMQQRERRWNEMLARTTLISSVVPAVIESPLHMVAACSGVLKQPAGKNWLAIGDAAQTWDPLSGQGIEKALRSGIAAADTILKAHAGDATALSSLAQKINIEFQEYRDTRLKYYGQEKRWAEEPFWQRRQAGDKPIRAWSAPQVSAAVSAH